MQDLVAVFIALSLLLSPLTIDRNGANNSASGDGAMTLTQQAEHSESGYHANGPVVSSIEGGGMSATTTEDKDNSDCPIKYPDPNSKAYCECVVDRTDNFVCNVREPRTELTHRANDCCCGQYDCSCSLGGILCSSSSCSMDTPLNLNSPLTITHQNFDLLWQI